VRSVIGTSLDDFGLDDFGLDGDFGQRKSRATAGLVAFRLKA
jgi:hypothetical protein